MELEPNLHMEMKMEIVLSRFPELVPELVSLRMYCVGCYLAKFHTISDAAKNHNINDDDFLAHLKNVLQT